MNRLLSTIGMGGASWWGMLVMLGYFDRRAETEIRRERRKQGETGNAFWVEVQTNYSPSVRVVGSMPSQEMW